MTSPIYPGDKVLDLFSRYAKNRNNEIFRLINNSLSKCTQPVTTVMEFGAGKGEFLNRYSGKNFRTIAIEADAAYRTILAPLHQTFEKPEDINSAVDFIFSIDVLEHIQDDAAALRSLFNKLSSKGRLFIYVPSRMELYSGFDKSIGHFRRYSKTELMNKVRFAGFRIEECRYHDFPGYVASLIHNKLFGVRSPSPLSLKLYDNIIVPISAAIEKLAHPPFGKSLWLSAVVNK